MLRPRERRIPQMPNHTPVFVEQRVLPYALGHAGEGPKRISAELRRAKWGGIEISPTAGERQLRMRARSTTGSVAGAASYNVGLAAHSLRTAYPSYVLPKAPGPVRLTLPPTGHGIWLSRPSSCPYNSDRAHTGRLTRGRTPRTGHRQGEDVAEEEVMRRHISGSVHSRWPSARIFVAAMGSSHDRRQSYSVTS
jgi:hypothetical protein